jgi:hypothetical protein
LLAATAANGPDRLKGSNPALPEFINVLRATPPILVEYLPVLMALNDLRRESAPVDHYKTRSKIKQAENYT